MKIPPYDPRAKNPPYPEDVTEDLRERMEKGDVTLSKRELERIIAMLEMLSGRCADAFHVVGALADYADMQEDPAVHKTMDLLAFPLRRGEISPFEPQRMRERARADRSREKWGKIRATYLAEKPGKKPARKSKRRSSAASGSAGPRSRKKSL